MHEFRQAVEAGDLDAVIALCRDDIVFRSPVVFTPYEGRDALRTILAAVMEVFEDFRYVREIGAADARDHALVFQARVGDKDIEGCDFIRTDENGAISELTVMVRPLSATLSLAETMKARLAGA
ncbi:nuclear transport factor 2 family protein [Mycolicibacterium novocastrense]|uniref:Nuclear transport factor 2 family protein n=1 Tax=Mycolicibacterium novocastrense TaxID=59813 RepID=A0AAW5SRM9_MYCNV|nr:nuclear transport factor 2 family protein [Mycolicibacterium novocastrense]MCV7026740.1 nuclear transport factor 2 family protein [Mycolicibacterium novocastrense]GAT10573.1 SnoaL-like polyketide cyclase [Mycolicibacterium novocastrense]